MEISKVKINEVKLNPNNPRVIKDDKFKKLVQSIKTFPEMLEIRPIVVNEDKVILGGNMRYKACKEAGLKEVYIIEASQLSEEQQREFIIKDNVGFGDWDWEYISQSDWDTEILEDWGLEVIGFDIDENELSDEFTLPEGDKNNFGTMKFTLSNEQIEFIKEKIGLIKKTNEFNSIDKMGNENSNGNAIYTIIKLWDEQKKLS